MFHENASHQITPGSIVRCRNRDWVLLPSEDPDLIRLRPLTGATDDVVVLHRGLSNLIGYSLPEERITPSQFKPPTPDDVSDSAGAHLLWQAARLTLRDGATPFRSLGRISITPRIYQFVPLLMALRLDPVRLFIADDVGVGKTIEALLIARELFDRGEIRRMVVLCPPYLCEQWQKELSEKFNLDAVIINSGTISRLERNKIGTDSLYRAYPVQVASIDFLKSERNRHQFLLDCPEFVIVDEAHGVAEAAENNKSQQQRHQLVREIAADQNRHLILLTATPHSGIDAAFRSLLSLLDPEFGTWNIAELDEEQRTRLARHFVQRTRHDIEKEWEGNHCFPTRRFSDETYRLSPRYLDLFNKTYEFCSEIVRTGQTLDRRRQRVRYWGALALLRCVMSSPAAAIATLEKRHDSLPAGEEEPDFRYFVFESSDETTLDEQPTPAVESAETIFADAERRRLRELAKLASSILHSDRDTKLSSCAQLLDSLLREGYHPIVWCRYIATAEYVAEGFKRILSRQHPKLRIICVTGRMADEERRALIETVEPDMPRILVATDCLSEGINLQDRFNAVLHYDLPWNPNRLEQREGRVDRYGQTSAVVKTIRFFSPDSAIDGVVIDVLLNKAREIHRALGTHVPVPEESETVTEAVLNALFLRRGRDEKDSRQLRFDFGLEVSPQVISLHRRWDKEAERERVNRTKFAQRAIKPETVRKELEAVDAVLGDPAAVREFVLSAAQRLSLAISVDTRPDVFKIAVSPEATTHLPDPLRQALPQSKSAWWRVSFVSPTPEGAEYLGRNHPFVAALARYLMEDALASRGRAAAARCGVIRTRSVRLLTTLLLLRVRYLIELPGRAPLLSEEIMVCGFEGIRNGAPRWLEDAEALRLLTQARPDANVPMAEKRELANDSIAAWSSLEKPVQERIRARAVELEQAHKRIRQAVSLRVRELAVKPHFPPDLLGVLVLQPEVSL